MGVPTAEDTGLTRRRYRPLLELGRGGMAKVYLAESLASGVRKLVVLKILNTDLAAEPAMRSAFRREAELSAQLNHPNMVQVFEVVEYSGVPVIVMEYLDGVALSRIAQQVTIPLRLHLYILTQVLLGLHHFHELRDLEGHDLNAVHRDVSPQNVLVLHDGPVKVVDFGIAKANSASNDQHTRTGLIKGKIHYMPPEQLLGDTDIDRRADVFAVGVMLWEAIAGKRMWEGQTEARVVRKLTQGELPRIREAVPDVSEDLEAIVERALSVERAQRYPTAEAMQHDLEQALVKSGGYVRTRELTDFMLAHFGDRRQFQQRTIERALRNPDVSLSGVMECVTATDLHSGSISRAMELQGVTGLTSLAGLSSLSHLANLSNLSPGTGSDVSVSVSSSSASEATMRAPRRWPWAIAALLAVVCAAGGWLAVSKPWVASAPTAGQVTPSVRVRVQAHPVDAEVFLDGERLGSGAVDRAVPRRNSDGTLSVRANGHVEERRPVRLDRDVTLDVTLSKATPAPNPETVANVATTPEPEEGASSTKTKTRARAGRASAVVKAVGARSAAATAPSTPAPNCNPPYKLSADGVKTFKPECF